MGKRKHIGLFFTYDENWIGGSYYIINLILALKLLPENERPVITIFYKEESDIDALAKLDYGAIDYNQIKNNDQLIKRIVRFGVRKILGKEILAPQLQKKTSRRYYDAIFPMPFGFAGWLSKKNIYWITDFQDKYLPHLFSAAELLARNRFHARVARSVDTVIFSSHDVQNDFNNFYPGNKPKQFVVPFAVTHPQYDHIDFQHVAIKYNLPGRYFFCPNQFWAHKNQQVILEAVQLLKHRFNQEIQVVFSGKDYDFRNKGYFDGLKQYVKDNNIEENISFLGFIDRREQLAIMKHALAVIQPSLFEGWSTVVEDAKAMNQNIIVSALRVHKEQLADQAVYFDPLDSDSLVTALLSFAKKTVEFDYECSRRKFASDFINALNG